MSGKASSLTTGLQAAWLLACGRAEGFRLVAVDNQPVGRSFWAMAACVPIIVATRLMDLTPASPDVSLLRLGARDLIVFAVAWLGYAVVSHRVAGVLGRGERWPRFIAAWNWCNVAENLLIVVGAVPGLLGAPPILDQAAQLFALGWAFWIEWYVTRTALGTTMLMAAWLVMLDESIGLMVSGLAQLLGGG